MTDVRIEVYDHDGLRMVNHPEITRLEGRYPPGTASFEPRWPDADSLKIYDKDSGSLLAVFKAAVPEVRA